MSKMPVVTGFSIRMPTRCLQQGERAAGSSGPRELHGSSSQLQHRCCQHRHGKLVHLSPPFKSRPNRKAVGASKGSPQPARDARQYRQQYAAVHRRMLARASAHANTCACQHRPPSCKPRRRATPVRVGEQLRIAAEDGHEGGAVPGVGVWVLHPAQLQPGAGLRGAVGWGEVCLGRSRFTRAVKWVTLGALPRTELGWVRLAGWDQGPA